MAIAGICAKSGDVSNFMAGLVSRRSLFRRSLQAALLGLVALTAAVTGGIPVLAADANLERRHYEIPAGPLALRLNDLARQAGVLIAFDPALAEGKRTNGVSGEHPVRAAFAVLLAGTGLEIVNKGEGAYTLRQLSSTTPAEKKESKGEEEDLHLATVNVTAALSSPYREEEATAGTKIPVPLRDLPMSVQVIPRQVIEDQGAIRTYDLMQNVSGVYRGNPSFGSDDFVFRGFSNSVYLRDGIPAGRSSSRDKTYRDTANIELIEVLKGPASVLYGRIEPGGTLNYVTKKPLFAPRSEVALRVDSFGQVRPSVDFSTVSVDGAFGMRFNGAMERGDGFRDFSFSDRNFGAGVLEWRPSRDTQFSVEFESLDDRRLFDRSGIPLLNGAPAPIPVSRILSEPTDFRDVRETLFGYTFDHKIDATWQFKHALRHYRSELNGALTSIRTSSLSSQVVTTVNPATGEADRQFSTESNVRNQLIAQLELIGDFRMANGMRHQPLFGVELDKSNGSDNNYQASTLVASNRINIFNPVYGRFVPVGLTQNTLSTSELNTASVYAQDMIELRPDWKLLIGARFDDVTRNTTTNLRNNTTAENNGSHALSPRAGIVWQPSKALSLYTSYSESFVPVIGQDFFGVLFKPTTGQQVEVGAKTEWFGGRLSATVAAYTIAKQNVSVSDSDHPGFSIQTGEITSDGVEFDVSGSPMRGLNLIGNLALTDARVTSDTNPLMVGTRPSNTPSRGAGLWASYELQGAERQGWGVGLGTQYVGYRVNSNNARDFHTLPSYVRWDSSLWYRTKKWKMSLKLENLFNKVYFVSGVNLGVFPGAPRNAALSASYQF